MSEAPLIPSIAGKRAVLVASTGGHLAQLHRLAPQLGLAADPLWFTFESEQSRSLLAGQRVVYLPYIAPRDVVALMRAGARARLALKRESYDVAISTGAAAALAVLPSVRMGRKSAVYIESVSRFLGPSLSGRLMSAIPGVDLYTQHEAWARGRWKYQFSVLDDFVPSRRAGLSRNEPLKVFVTLGTIKPYRFDRLVDRLLEVAPNASFTWQLGETAREDLPGDVQRYLTAEEFDRFTRAADVVVTHAGVGTALMLLEQGIFPVLAPRRASFKEHVDDHQLQIAQNLDLRGLAMSPEVSDLTLEHLLSAAGRSVSRGR